MANGNPSARGADTVVKSSRTLAQVLAVLGGLLGPITAYALTAGLMQGDFIPSSTGSENMAAIYGIAAMLVVIPVIVPFAFALAFRLDHSRLIGIAGMSIVAVIGSIVALRAMSVAVLPDGERIVGMIVGLYVAGVAFGVMPMVMPEARPLRLMFPALVFPLFLFGASALSVTTPAFFFGSNVPPFLFHPTVVLWLMCTALPIPLMLLLYERFGFCRDVPKPEKPAIHFITGTGIFVATLGLSALLAFVFVAKIPPTLDEPAPAESFDGKRLTVHTSAISGDLLVELLRDTYREGHPRWLAISRIPSSSTPITSTAATAMALVGKVRPCAIGFGEFVAAGNGRFVFSGEAIVEIETNRVPREFFASVEHDHSKKFRRLSGVLVFEYDPEFEGLVVKHEIRDAEYRSHMTGMIFGRWLVVFPVANHPGESAVENRITHSGFLSMGLQIVDLDSGAVLPGVRDLQHSEHAFLSLPSIESTIIGATQTPTGRLAILTHRGISTFGIDETAIQRHSHHPDNDDPKDDDFRNGNSNGNGWDTPEDASERAVFRVVKPLFVLDQAWRFEQLLSNAFPAEPLDYFPPAFDGRVLIVGANHRRMPPSMLVWRATENGRLSLQGQLALPLTPALHPAGPAPHGPVIHNNRLIVRSGARFTRIGSLSLASLVPELAD